MNHITRIARSWITEALVAASLVAAANLSGGHGAAGSTLSTASTASTTSTAPTCGTAIYKPNGTRWKCTLDDEFTGTSLNSALWTVQTTAKSGYTTGPKGNKACYLPKEVSVSGGVLNLAIHRDKAFTCRAKKPFTSSYSAGMVSTVTQWSQTYGRFEVRAKLPANTTPGVQETLWLWPVDDTKYGPVWPASGEIDFSEFYSKYPQLDIPYFHYVENGGQSVTTYSCSIKRGVFNTYVLNWLPGELSVQVNGRTCLDDHYKALNALPPAPFNQPFFLALTQALGQGTNAPTSSTAFPAVMQVDYVRAWS